MEIIGIFPSFVPHTLAFLSILRQIGMIKIMNKPILERKMMTLMDYIKNFSDIDL